MQCRGGGARKQSVQHLVHRFFEHITSKARLHEERFGKSGGPSPTTRCCYLPAQSYQIIDDRESLVTCQYFAVSLRNFPHTLHVLRPQCSDPHFAALGPLGNSHAVEEGKGGSEAYPRSPTRTIFFTSPDHRNRESRGASRTPSVLNLWRVAFSYSNSCIVGYSVFAFNQTIHKKLDPKTHQNLAQTLTVQLRRRPGIAFLKRVTIVLDEDSEKGFGLVSGRTYDHLPLSQVDGFTLSTGEHELIDFLRL